jgi:hypothetical protein
VVPSDAEAVRRSIIPAIEAKITILKKMEQAHKAIGRPTLEPLSEPYGAFESLLAVMQERARAQFDAWTAWIEEPSADVDTLQLDAAESHALDISVASLNALIDKAGLKLEAWLDLNCGVFNTVRKSVGLAPLTETDFRMRFFAGQAGLPARFFRD